MHRYRIVAQISLILSILNLILAAPIVVQEIHEARGDEMVVAGDVAAMPKWPELEEAASDGSASPPPSPDTMVSPQHSSLSDGSTSSGYPAPHLSSDSSVSGYSWLLDRPPRPSPSPNLPASLYELASPHPSSSGSSEMSLPWWLERLEMPPSPHLPALLQGLASPRPSSSGSSEIPLLEPLQGLAPEEIPPTPPAWLQELAPPLPHPSSSVSLEIPPSPQLTGSNYSPPDQFTPSHHPLSSTDWSTDWYSDKSMSTRYSSASGESLSSYYLSASDGFAPSYNSISEGSPSSPPPPPTETTLENAEFLNKNMIKKLKIVAGVTIVGGIIAGIAGSQIKHRDCQDS